MNRKYIFESLFILLNICTFKIGNWDGGTPLEKVVEAAFELRIPGLLQVKMYNRLPGWFFTSSRLHYCT